MAANLSQSMLDGSGIVPSLIQELAAGGFSEGRESFHDYIYSKFLLGDDRGTTSGIAHPGVSVFTATNINCPDSQVMGHEPDNPSHSSVVRTAVNCSTANEVKEISNSPSVSKSVIADKAEGSKKRPLQLQHGAGQQINLSGNEGQRKLKKKNLYKKKEKTFVCEVCGRGFAEKYTMNRHMFTHTRVKPYSCSKCKMSFARSDGLAKHVAAGHRRVDSHHCDVCGGTFSSELSFEQHRREYGNTLPFVCNLCMLAFSQCCHLNYHMKSHPLSKLNEGFDYDGDANKNNDIDMSELVPEDCNSPRRQHDDFAVKDLMNKLSRTGSRDIGNRLFSMDVFNPHIVIKPEIEDFPTCSSVNNQMYADGSLQVSGKGSQSSDSLNIISLSTSASRDVLNSLASQQPADLPEGRPNMQDASKNLNTSASDKANPVSDAEMKKYYDIKIPNPKYRESSSIKGGAGEDGLFRCDRCGKGFSRKYHMQRHVKLHIRGPVPRAHLLDWTRRPYACGVCKMGFTRQHHLTRHILIHTGERPHSCHICDKAFRRFTNLTLHIRTVHGAERPFKCHICGRGFPRLYSLQRHQKLHLKNSYMASAENGNQLYEGFKPVGTASIEAGKSPSYMSVNSASTSQSSASGQRSGSIDSCDDAAHDRYKHKMNTQTERVGSSELAEKDPAMQNPESYILVQEKGRDASFQNDLHIQNKDQTSGCHPGEAESRSNQAGLAQQQQQQQQQQQIIASPGAEGTAAKVRLASPHSENLKSQNSGHGTVSTTFNPSTSDHGEVIRSQVSFQGRNVSDFGQQQQQQTLQSISEDRMMSVGAISNQNLRIINIGHEMGIRDMSGYVQNPRNSSSEFIIQQQQLQNSLSLLNMIERPGSRSTIGQVSLPETYHHPSTSYNQAVSSIQIQPGANLILPVSCSTLIPGNLQELAGYTYTNHVEITANASGVSDAAVVYSHSHSMPFHTGVHGTYQHHLSDNLDQDMHSHPTPVNSHNNMQY